MDEEFGEEWFEPGGVVVLVTVDHFLHYPGIGDSGTGVAEVEVLVAAVGALKGNGDMAIEGETAAVAEWGLYRLNPIAASPADGADVAFASGGRLRSADLADIRV